MHVNQLRLPGQLGGQLLAQAFQLQRLGLAELKVFLLIVILFKLELDLVEVKFAELVHGPRNRLLLVRVGCQPRLGNFSINLRMIDAFVVRRHIEAQHPLVVNQHFTGEALDDPRMLQSFQRGDPPLRIPHQDLLYKVQESC